MGGVSLKLKLGERRWGLGEGWRPLARTRDCVSWMVHPAEKGHFPFPKGMLKIVGYTIQLLKGPPEGCADIATI